MSKKKTKRAQGALLGLGLDNDDGQYKAHHHGRAKFAIYGGSAETHERMTETVVKTSSRS